ncbi:MAG: glycerol-3-phosphate dehydrogenase/oxidase [Myxococcales bacterium FL481]|nr:MAG: glycerol-3-phosphate dehydrogenase/oxidase [Myxococcales bacterium FL481]
MPRRPPPPTGDALSRWGAPELNATRRSLAAPSDWDLVVIGAGITGAGVARDAALRGMRVLVLEADDVGSGTSCRSSRLVHGGVRYLEQADFGLVFEAIRERQSLVRLAPHLVTPQRFMLTTYRGDRVGATRLRLGLGLYDALSLWRARPHAFLSPKRARAAEPILSSTDLRGAVLYDDAVTDDFRLTLSVLNDARLAGATVATHCAVASLGGQREAHRIQLDNGPAITARAVVVATGPWTSERLLGPVGARLLSLSKGIHLTLRASDVPVRHPLVFQVPRSRRLLFVVPWGTRTYLGTSDDPFTGDPRDVCATPDEQSELLAAARRWMPAANLELDRVVSAWAGVRPLVSAGIPGNTEELSRSHRLVESERGVLGIVGGKLTTYRAMAEEVVDKVVAMIAPNAPNAPNAPSGWRACETASRPVVAGEPLRPDEWSDPLIRDLAPRHGPTSRDLAARARARPDLAARLVDDLPYRAVEIEHAITSEGAEHLDDVLRRRLPLALADPLLGAGVARQIATMLVDHRGGTSREIDDELERYRVRVRQETSRELPAVAEPAPPLAMCR